jgi:hypothetical protein
MRQLGRGKKIASVVAMNDMHRQFEFLQHAQRGGCYHVTAMQHGLGTMPLGVLHGMFEQTPVIVAIGKQADFH